jgi:hypothetical protein
VNIFLVYCNLAKPKKGLLGMGLELIMLWVMLSSGAKGFSSLEFDYRVFSYLNVVVTFLAILSSFPKVAPFLEELVLVEIMDWLAIARG